MLKIQMLHFCRVSKYIMKLSAVRKVLETPLFLALGSFGTLGPKLIEHGQRIVSKRYVFLESTDSASKFLFWLYPRTPFVSLISHGTSCIAEIIHWIISPNVRTHLRKVSKRSLSSIKKEPEGSFLLFSIHLDLKVKIVIDSKQLLA